MCTDSRQLGRLGGRWTFTELLCYAMLKDMIPHQNVFQTCDDLRNQCLCLINTVYVYLSPRCLTTRADIGLSKNCIDYATAYVWTPLWVRCIPPLGIPIFNDFLERLPANLCRFMCT